MKIINKLLVVIGLALSTITVQASEKPNVIFIMIDNWGGDVAYNGDITSLASRTLKQFNQQPLITLNSP